MGYNFPNAPTVGQVANGYSWDGVTWKGVGAGVANVTQENFIDLSGLSTIDITVPSWAKGAQIQSTMFMAAAGTSGPGMQVSFDGTTFIAGATDYQYQGFLQNTGSAGFVSTPQQGFSSFILAPVAGTINAIVPSTADWVIELVRKAADVLMLRGTGRCFDNAAASLGRNFTQQEWVTTAAAGSNLRVQKLRIITNGAGNFGAGSWVRIKWLGDLATQPSAGNAISDAPSDNIIYRRRNGVWYPRQAGEVLGGAAIKHASYASVGTTPTYLAGVNYVARGTNSIYQLNANVAGAASAVNIVAWCGVYIGAGLLNFCGQQAYIANGYMSPALSTMFSSTIAAGTNTLFSVYAWSSSGTLYINGSSGGGAASMSCGINIVEIAT